MDGRNKSVMTCREHRAKAYELREQDGKREPMNVLDRVLNAKLVPGKEGSGRNS